MNLSNYIKENLTPEEIEAKKLAALDSHMRLYISKDIAEILKRVEHPISDELLNLSKKNVKFDISFVDKTDDSGNISFIQTDRVKRMEEKGLDAKTARNDYKSEIWTSGLRTSTRINRFINKIFKNKYNAAEIEKFGNQYKASFELKDEKMKVVYGKDIQKWYLEENYADTKGSLGGSCMRYKAKNNYLEIYADNSPDSETFSHIGLLILLDNNNKLLGRALIWFNSIKPEPGKIFMDRIYTTHDHDVDTFKNYAKNHNWLYKYQQTYNNATYIDPKDTLKHNLSLSFRLKNKSYKYYPFCDTLLYYTPDTGRLSTTLPTVSAKNKFKIFKIQNQDGGYQNAN